MDIVDLTDILKSQTTLADRHSGFHADLSSITFEEVTKTDDSGTEVTVDASWVHSLSIGEFKHPLWGKISLTADRMKRFADSVNNKVRGVDIAIDYDHFSDGAAAGWVQKAEARDNGLWMFVEWTKKAAEQIRNKEYRYFSSEFADEWEDAQGNEFQDVIIGGGLTNRPFLKNLLPVNLSELYGKPLGKEKQLELTEQLRQALGLSEEATEEDALEAIKKLSEPKPAPTPDPAIPVELSENPIVKGLIDQVSELKAARTLSEAKALTDKWTTKNADRKFSLPPAVQEDLETILVGGSTELNEKVTAFVEHILENGLVQLGEIGTGSGRRKTGDDDESAVKAFNLKVKELMEGNESMAFADAYDTVARDNEELFHRYREETMAGVVAGVDSDEEEDD